MVFAPSCLARWIQTPQPDCPLPLPLENLLAVWARASEVHLKLSVLLVPAHWPLKKAAASATLAATVSADFRCGWLSPPGFYRFASIQESLGHTAKALFRFLATEAESEDRVTEIWVEPDGFEDW